MSAAFSRRTVVCFTAALLLLAALPLPAGTGACIWEIRHPELPGELILAGTVHLGKPDFYPLDRVYDDALKKSDTLIFEIANPASLRTAAFMMKHGIYSNKASLSARLGDARFAKLSKIPGLPAPYSLNRMKPWLVWSLVQMQPVINAGYRTEYGFEHIFRAAAGDRKIESLETEEEQLAILAKADEEELIHSLDSVLDNPDKLVSDAASIIRAVLDGNAVRLAGLIDMDRKDAPKLSAELIDRRNERMAEKLFQRMKQPDVALVLIGAGHCAGKTSVTELLLKRGCKVVQLLKTGEPGDLGKAVPDRQKRVIAPH